MSYPQFIKNRQTGTTIEVGPAEVPADGGKWACICVEHGGICQHDTARQMWDWARSPVDWCPGCQEAHTP